jgi:hypothetical protein
MNLDRGTWLSASHTERSRIVEAVLGKSPSGFSFERVERFALGGEQNEVALFAFERSEFAFVPGCEAEIGFDAHYWSPNDDELQSWEESVAEFELDLTIHQYLEQATHRPRKIQIPPMLVETIGFELPWEPVSERHPLVKELLRCEPRRFWSRRLARRPEPALREVYTESEAIRVSLETDGSVLAERQHRPSLAEASSQFAATGFRLLSSDEWEYLCSGGCRTLFRWGDHAPCDVDPCQTPDTHSGRACWDEHRRPNALGLNFPDDTYQGEIVAEGFIRGGDGGASSCGGVGYFVAWSTLASAYVDANQRIARTGGSRSVYDRVRRIRELC